MIASAQAIWAFVFAVGSVQGLFLGATLMHLPSSSRIANKLLGVLILIFAFDIAEEFVEAAQLIDALPHLLLGTFTLPLMIGPLLFLYGQYLTQNRKAIRTQDYLHLLPVILATLYFLPFYLQSGEEKLVSMREGVFAKDIIIFATIKGVHMCMYFSATLYLVHSYAKRNESLDQTHLLRVLWYKRFLYAVIGILLVTGGLYYGQFLGQGGFWDSDRVASLLLTLVIYGYAFIAIKHPGSLSDIQPLRLREPQEPTKDESALKYQTSALNDAEKQHYMRLLVQHMEMARPYLDPDLGRKDIALALSLSVHNVSQIINEELDINFYEFINRYRVEEVKSKLGAGEQAYKTLLAIAYEAGFSSKSSFNRVFKKHTGRTPTQYISELH